MNIIPNDNSGFNAAVERDEQPANVLHAIQQLMENEDFLLYWDKGFTLLLEKHEELSEPINALISPVHGRLMFNHGYEHQVKPWTQIPRPPWRSGRPRDGVPACLLEAIAMADRLNPPPEA